MFKRLLIPLDGSRLAEAALPPAASLAQITGAEVTLLHLIERDAPHEVHHERHLSDPGEAESYLSDEAAQYFDPGTPVSTHVHTYAVSDIPAAIVEHSQEMEEALIVMCTHGRSGVRGWLFGNIPQQVIAAGSAPVMLVPPLSAGHAARPGAGAWRSFMVPLDGQREHEGGLEYATDLAALCQAAIHLLMVIPKIENLNWEAAATGWMLPGSMAAVLDMAEQGGKEYLTERLGELRGRGFSLTAEVDRGDPVQVIVNAARRINADLIVLATHGKTGMDAFWSGSFTPKVSSKLNIPMLLVPVGFTHRGSEP